MRALSFPALTTNMPTETAELSSSEKIEVHLLSRHSLFQRSAMGCKEASVHQAWIDVFQSELFTQNIAKSAQSGYRFC